MKWSFDGDRLTHFPFFYRDQHSSIYFPCDGNGWYWKPEVDAALRAWNSGKLSTDRWKGKIEVIESWEFQPYIDVKPFAFVRDLYNTRRLWKELGNPAEKVMKFTTNSIYGKIIQSIGGTEEHKPTYYNIGWDGYITSTIRAQLFDAIMQASEQIVNIVSDGIFSLVPLDLPLGDGMGQWEANELDGIVIAQSGVYWALLKLEREPTDSEQQSEYFDDNYWQYEGEWYRVGSHYQAYDRGTLTVGKVVEAWKQLRIFDTIPVPSTRFVTLSSAMASEELWQYWRTWRTIERKLELKPSGKRIPNRQAIGDNDRIALNALVPTMARLVIEASMGQMSHKYKPKWERTEDKDYIIDGVDHQIYELEHLDSES